MKRYVLDASALIAFLEDRSGAAVIEDLLGKAAANQQFLQMSVVGWGELYTAISRGKGHDTAGQKMEDLEQLPIELADVDSALTRSAAELSVQHKLSYLSCIGAVTAKARKATFVTTEKGFESVGEDLKLLLV
jgi:predicted nucleic acid-binding protein